MRTETPPTIHLADYRPSDHLIDRVDLDIRLDPHASRVTALLALRPNPQGKVGAPLVLDGDELKLVSLAMDGEVLLENAYTASPSGLTIHRPPQRPFTLAIETEIDPTANTKLMGLYRSSGVYCTQCEADGFRRITYFLDRPDILSIYTTRIEASREEAPVLLGNGNPVGSGDVPGTDRHYAIWQDPHPKPAYLFAIVGGRLGSVTGRFTTSEGREVALGVYVEPGKEARADYALDAVIRSMKWDEEGFGRAYDLDVFNVVAVSDFNMGAMENKGLNIFNDKYVLASPETATDADYANIEAIIAHEYFHNWSGNRVTCRDWFQLCLKEGLTVFRDQEFSSDMRSRAVHRISEVRTLRARQFPEDAGPLAHPVRPKQYAEINNFYTATVYEKGAEIVRMLKTLIGEDAFRKGMDRYFADNDGTAATVEDFLAAFATETGRDLSHFAQWYERPGTPRIAVTGTYDAAAKTYRLDFRQTRPGAGADAPPLVIPVALGLVGEDGPLAARSERVQDGVFVLDKAEDSVTFESVASRPVPSLFRDFSAPVRVEINQSDAERLTLLRHDTDAFNRWESAQRVALRIIIAAARGGSETLDGAEGFADALAAFLDQEAVNDPAFAALMLALPSEGEVASEIGANIDPDAIFAARRRLREAIALRLRDPLIVLRERLAEPAGAPFSPDAASAGRRAFRNAALDLIAVADPDRGTVLAREQIAASGTMTDRLAGLATLSQIPGDAREAELAAFAERYAGEPLILDKWLAIQAAIPEDGTIARIRQLQQHPAFSITNPNRVRSLVGVFSLSNPTQFNRADGAGYALVAETVLALDKRNPQVAARLLTAFGSWRQMEPRRRAAAEETLRGIVAVGGLSRDVADIAGRSLAS
ncbi:aminopeptidase N [Methylobacterium gnaphalii]|uniref:Aminopeptidase N n=1 Tax=Methylobacterium gnaphalii TaxID=1010610 RepID=A0A512JL52_9HYPH|nr:aminopeptidase N [Methylobacterium gnaphalii]GEP10622.1 aminopeptidase N [Methylobacterium gnaphalii]GJD69105.1 Aminopeptidase N [Methylobacterium gnaphalii]GLS48499.1 aminopeptidase N [Methylobacterium gnaphalii]